MDAIADKILVNGVLIALAYDSFSNCNTNYNNIKNTFVDSIKMAAGSKGKAVAASI